MQWQVAWPWDPVLQCSSGISGGGAAVAPEWRCGSGAAAVALRPAHPNRHGVGLGAATDRSQPARQPGSQPAMAMAVPFCLPGLTLRACSGSPGREVATAEPWACAPQL